MGQILLLAIWAFFCLTPGDALKCRQCISLDPSAPCEPFEECDIHPVKETCFSMISYFNGKVEHKILTCKRKKYANCGTTFHMKQPGISFEYACCSDRDFCNDI